MEGIDGKFLQRKWIQRALGWGFLGMGVLGLVLPLVAGLPFLLAGLVILSKESSWARMLLSKLRRRFPALAARMNLGTRQLWRVQAGRKTGSENA